MACPDPTDLAFEGLPLEQWIGRKERRSDLLTPALVKRFEATLDLPADDMAPAGIHWCLCTPDDQTGKLAEDGHPARGGFLPPIALPRRMWAGGELEFLRPLRIGEEVVRQSVVRTIETKDGRTGLLAFVTVDHELRANGRIVIRERQDIVYRGSGSRPVKPRILDKPHRWTVSRTVRPAAPLLFRYSAMTFNSHRIHYDRSYAKDVEGYPDLVVPGPLIATLLLGEAAHELGADRLHRFRFRAISPTFVDQDIALLSKLTNHALELNALGADGRIVMEASAEPVAT